MYKTLLIIIFNINFVFGQTKLNHRLKLELDSIFILDQKYRELLSLSDSQTSFDSIAKTYKIPNEKLNSFLISKLIETQSAVSFSIVFTFNL